MMRHIKELLPPAANKIDQLLLKYIRYRIPEELNTGEVYVLIGDKGKFKTSLLIEFALANALKETIPVIILSPKKMIDDLMFKLISSAGKLPLGKLTTGCLHDDDWKHLTEALNQLNDSNIYIDNSNFDELSIIKKLRTIKLIENKLALIAVDDLPIIKHEDESLLTNDIELRIRFLNQIAKEFDVPIIVSLELRITNHQSLNKTSLNASTDLSIISIDQNALYNSICKYSSCIFLDSY